MKPKQFLFSIIIIALIIEILLFPNEAMSYAATGLTLWFNHMIPALFPFMVLSGLIIRLDLAPSILAFFHPFMFKLFRTNIYCEYAILMGFLCGYPMGAIIIHDLLMHDKITDKQAEYLLAFCNNIGPVFFCSLLLPIFNKDYHWILLVGMYGVPFLYGLLLRYTFYRKTFVDNKAPIHINPKVNRQNSTEESFSIAFTDSLNQAVRSSLFLGACMIFFNMLRFLPMHYLKHNLLLSSVISWLLEVNGALFMTKDLYEYGLRMTSLLLIPFLAIGGLSCLCQTMGILADTPCRLSKYLFHKGIQWLVWLIIMLLWLLNDILQSFYTWNVAG